MSKEGTAKKNQDPVAETAPEVQDEKVELKIVDSDAGTDAGGDASVRPATFAPLPDESDAGEQNSVDILLDVELNLSVELGRTSIPVREILQLGSGSIVELERLAGEPVDIMINGRLIARGEVVVVDENFGVRVTEIASQSERLHRLA